MELHDIEATMTRRLSLEINTCVKMPLCHCQVSHSNLIYSIWESIGVLYCIYVPWADADVHNYKS